MTMKLTPQLDALSGGFIDPAAQSARCFRAVLEAMARPGRIEVLEGALPPAPLSIAAGCVLLTLADSTTPVHLGTSVDTDAVRDWMRFHIGAPIVAAVDASFAVGTWADLLPIDRFSVGLPDYPDRSATLILEMNALSADGARLTGPGIETEARLSLPRTTAFRDNRALFPMGLDFVLTSGDQMAALPRSTRVEDL
jgi:alpha-D-ribose 1-methylphosphonate 5-triphosphate synthase subunit PhnH